MSQHNKIPSSSRALINDGNDTWSNASCTWCHLARCSKGRSRYRCYSDMHCRTTGFHEPCARLRLALREPSCFVGDSQWRSPGSGPSFLGIELARLRTRQRSWQYRPACPEHLGPGALSSPPGVWRLFGPEADEIRCRLSFSSYRPL